MVRNSTHQQLDMTDNHQSTTPTPYKPSPLSFNSPRTSPFRRPNSVREPNSSPAQSPSTARPSTPNSSPLKLKETPTQSQTPLRQSTTSNASNNPPPWLNTHGTTTTAEPPSSPTRHVSTS